ncbi:MAG: hypothetical protein AUG48_11270 [Actinobacteria bacterium 13_1_20CM_3_68_9]|nr:MAG: hypothetical protein AUG48_11270 [Actinobacteria bacterium 13_1_20CM_3_68_9]
MKRVLIGAGLVVALAFPATIIAGVRHYEGTVDQGGTTRFLTKVRHGETVKVRRFVFNHVPMQCDNGPSTVGDVGTPPPGMKVNARHRFHGNFTSGGGRKHLHIDGKLRHHDRKAKGTLRVRGDFGGSSTNCDTGSDDWSAARTGGAASQ